MKQRKRRIMDMCSDKNEVLFPHAGNKKKRSKETFYKNKVNFGLCNKSNDFNNENLQSGKNEVRTFNEMQEFRNQKDLNDIKEDEPSSQNKMFLNNVNKPKILNKNSETSNVNHVRCTGSNNWERFLLGQGKEYVITKNPVDSTRKQTSKTFHSSKNQKLTKVVGMDCEMVGTGEDGRDNLLARVSIVNLYGDCLYDKFVKPRETVTDYRTHISGVRAADLKNAEDFESVQEEVATLIKGRILVGHAIKNDLEVLFLSHPRHQIRDTAKFFRKKGTGTPSLKSLAAEYLDVKIQSGEHSSVQDAQAAVQLYNMYRKQWETGGGNKKNNRIDSSHL